MPRPPPKGRFELPIRAREATSPSGRNASISAALGRRSIVLVGMPGAGKSSIGRRLAARLDLPFRDADAEIEAAAGMSIPEIFQLHGEPAFRDGEYKVIARLLGEGPQVLATGGGAFMNAITRENVARSGISVWLKADADVLFARIRRRTNRPLLAGPDPRGTLERLMRQREPVFATCDITVVTADGPHEQVVQKVLDALDRHLPAPAVADATGARAGQRP